jgi:uncharacterized cupin superfamily protein
MSAVTAETASAAGVGFRSFVVRRGKVEGLGVAPALLFPPDDPLSAGRRWHVSDPTLRYGAGIAETSACDLSIARMPHSEFVLISNGEVALQEASGRTVRLAAGDCAVIPAGAAVRWTQVGRVMRSFVVFPDAADDGATAIVTIDPDAPVSPMAPSASSAFLTAPPETANRRDFVARAGKVRAGLWQGSPYARRQITPPHCELMYLLRGAVELTEPSGSVWSLEAGDSITVPAGATNGWTSKTTVRKVFCLVS